MKFQIGLILALTLACGLQAIPQGGKSDFQVKEHDKVGSIPICHDAELIFKILVEQASLVQLTDVAITFEEPRNVSLDISIGTVSITGLELTNLTSCTYLSGNETLIIYTVDEVTIDLTDFAIVGTLGPFNLDATASASIQLVDVTLNLDFLYYTDEDFFAHIYYLGVDLSATQFSAGFDNSLPITDVGEFTNGILKGKKVMESINDVISKSVRYVKFDN
ncbi:UNVERIFIED_CONTAM: hypothetical protein RMT77_000660 [Armadillidium vulgare]